MHRQSGYTIVELMITVTVLGVLAAVAIPFYQHYTTRAKVAEGLSLAHGAKTAIADYFVSHGGFPPDNAAAALPAPADFGGRIVDTVSVRDAGVIEVLFRDPALAGHRLVFTPTQSEGALVWSCATTLPEALRPKQECP